MAISVRKAPRDAESTTPYRATAPPANKAPRNHSRRISPRQASMPKMPSAQRNPMLLAASMRSTTFSVWMIWSMLMGFSPEKIRTTPATSNAR